MTYYPPDADLSELRNHLMVAGFVKVKPFLMIDHPGSVAHFSWFESADFLSTNGVEATVI